MFDRVAGNYDALNSVMTAGLHHRWRERAAELTGLEAGDAALDVCCGTGDLALELAGRVSPGGHVVGCDFSEPMLDLAREKASAQQAAGVRFEWADALQLPYDGERFDAVTVGFGARNLADLDRGLREMARVLQARRAGGDPRDHAADAPAALVLLLALVRPDRAAARHLLERARGLLLSAGVGSQLPQPARSGGEDGRRRVRADPLLGAGRRHHRDPQRRPRVTRRSAVPPPVTAVLDASSRWLPARLGEVEDSLRAAAAGHGEVLGSDAEATLSAGGKRLRPMLVLLCAGEAGGPASVRAAAAIELIHMATLVHDDVLDEAPLRRGLPTVAASSGRDRAVATGDLLFSRAFALLADAGDGRAVALLAEASVALARGELAQRHDAFDLTISEQRYLHRCRLKTGKLFECACLLGHDDEHLRAFGAEIGLAFQLLDDVLDVEGPPERTGKARGTDLLDGTITLPLIEAAQADPGIREVDLHALDAAAAERLCDRIAATGALTRVRDRALEMVAAAKRELTTADFAPEQRQLLDLVADGVVQRYS